MDLESTLVIDDLSLNTKTFEVSRNGKTIWLSRREFDLLAYLMKSAPRVVSKDELIEAVWREAGSVLVNTVEVCIGYLRRKVDAPFSDSPKLIRTRRGFGYVVSAKAPWGAE